ncbi:MAG: glycosyltransferase family 2 protein [Rhodobacteraceae bacterium]|nr:glycosyltransferase family 2 protein [Paracoccaceae bacterium]
MSVAAVIIGRNEGQRLIRCLESVRSATNRIIYVDSGSTDDSIAAARAAGAEVIALDPSRPFTAARARSEGFEALQITPPLPDYVQFVDGDCVLQPGWIAAAQKAMEQDETLGVVTGWRSEIHRDDSIYNAMCDFEWHRPAGDILTCGGDMMVRSHAFDQVGGFDPIVIAAEDDEFCIRVRNSGWSIKRIPVEMTQHDAAMTRFSQWWQRGVRSGHGFAQVGAMHKEYFVRERQRVIVYGAVLPLFAALGIVLLPWLLIPVCSLYLVSFIRTALGLKRNGLMGLEPYSHAALITLSKFPNFQGFMTYFWRRSRGHKMNIIEYK